MKTSSHISTGRLGRLISHRKHRLLALISAVAVVAIFTVPQLFGSQETAALEADAPIRVLEVEVMPVAHHDAYQRTRAYLGKVESQRTSRLGFEVAGMLAAIYVREGQAVTEGQLLAELDTDRLEAAKAETAAQLLEAQATLRLASATLKRTQEAHRLKAVSVQQLDEAVSTLERQRARVVRVEAQLNRINVDLEKSKLFAPYAGTLSARMSDEGAVLPAGQPVLEITETARTEIRIGFDRDLAEGLAPGTEVDAVVRGQSINLRIDRILPGRESLTRVVQVMATPSRPDIHLREGDLVEVTLQQSVTQSGVWLPVSALTENARGLWSCLVAQPLDDGHAQGGATHRLQRRELQIVSLEGERVFVSGRFQAGEQVVVDGLHRVVPNQRVRLAAGDLAQQRPPANADGKVF